MPQALRFDPEQRFTCAQCGLCCRRAWDIAVTGAEVEAYRRARAERWYSEQEGGAEGAARDPFEPIEGGFFLIRKRADGACGFLSPANRCRIHEEMGGAQKPLACRVYPFRFHPAGAGPVATASASCPTVAAGVGAPVGAQARDLQRLLGEWSRAFPEASPTVMLVDGRALPPAALSTVRETLRAMLDRAAPDGPVDLRANVLRMARWLEDISRHRVTRLPDEALAEYILLTGRHAAGAANAPPARPPSRLARTLFRGLLLAAVAAHASPKVGRLRQRLRLARVLAHLHGLAPASDEIDVRAARLWPADVNAPALQPIVHALLRAAIATLGTGRRPVIDELALSVAVLDAACVLASARAGEDGVTAAGLTDALTRTAELTHADQGPWRALLSTFAGGPESLYRFASGRPV